MGNRPTKIPISGTECGHTSLVSNTARLERRRSFSGLNRFTLKEHLITIPNERRLRRWALQQWEHEQHL
jgi:hypothetical protein